jgi:hypothetical protein
MKVRTNFVSLACAKGMTLGATRLEKRSTAFGVTYKVSRNAYESLKAV